MSDCKANKDIDDTLIFAGVLQQPCSEIICHRTKIKPFSVCNHNALTIKMLCDGIKKCAMIMAGSYSKGRL